jgi:hypothetical protein
MANYNKSFNFRNGVQVDNDNFVVNANGLVGIGTTIPTDFLDVYGTSKFNDPVRGTVITLNKNLAVGIVSITSGIITASSGIVTYYGDGGKLFNLPTSQWIDVDPGFGFTSIYSAGNVGIATTIPTYTFQVGRNPDTNQGIGFNSTGDIKASGIITANSFSGFGTDVQGINASNISNGILNNSRLPQNISVSGIITSNTGFVGGATSLSSTLDVTGITTLRNQLVVGGATSLSGTLNVTGITTLKNQLVVGSATSLSSTLDVTGIATLRNQLIVGGATSLSSTLNVTGVATFNNSIVGNLVGIASTALSLSGTPNITVGTIDSGTIRATQISASGITSIKSNLFVDGNVGFGTSSPNTNFHLRKSGAASVQITSNTSESFITIGSSVSRNQNNGEIRFGNNGGSYSNSNSLDIVNYSTGNINQYLNNAVTGTGNFNWINGPSQDILMILQNNGYLGIGLTNPINNLHVVGTSTVTSDSYVGNNLYVKNTLKVLGSLDVESIILNSSLTTNLIGNVFASSGISTFRNVNVDTNLFVGANLAIGKTVSTFPFELGSTLYAGGNFVGIFTDTQLQGSNVNAKDSRIIIAGVGVGSTAPVCAVDFSTAGVISPSLSDPFFNISQRFMLPPKVTTTQRNTLNVVEGGLIYNTTSRRLELFNGTTWVGIATIA